MSRFLKEQYQKLEAYTPGEQPRDMQYIKLNTNESPFPPAPSVVAAMNGEEVENLRLYSDPTAKKLHEALAANLGVDADEVLATNGSDEILNFAFMAYCDKDHGAAFADLTYGFYPVFAQLNGIPYTEIPTMDDFSIRVEDYFNLHKTIFIANPNAPTGIFLPKSEIERILRANPDSVVVVDEAYVAFGGESCVDLIHTYDNLLVTRTFSKSHSMAGARLGDASNRIVATGVPMSAVPQVSRFWDARTTNGSHLLTWENFFLQYAILLDIPQLQGHRT